MWFASETGLFRFDGTSYRQFRPFPQKPSFDNAITALQEDDSARLWLGTASGLLYFNRRTERINPCAAIPSSLNIAALCKSVIAPQQELLFVAGNDTLYALSPATMSLAGQLPLKSVITYLHPIASQNAVLVATRAGVIRVNVKISQSTISRASSGIHAENCVLSIADTISPNTSISALCGLSDGRIALGNAAGGVELYDAHSKQLSRIPTGKNRILALQEDAEGKLWCATAGDGVLTLSTSTNTAERRPEAALQGRFVSAMAVVHSSSHAPLLWLGASDGALYKAEYVPQHFQYIVPDSRRIPEAESLLVLAVFEDSERTLWLGTQNGLLSYTPTSKQWRIFRHNPTRKNSISGNNISCMYEDSRGMLWIGTTGSGLNRYDRKRGIFTAFRNDSTNPASISSNNISCIYEDSRGRLWIGAWINGLNLFNPDNSTFTQYRSSPDKISTLSSNSISYIREDRMVADGTLWIGTYEDGVNAFHPTIQAFTRHLNNPAKPNSLSSNAVSAIFEQMDGTLWVTTDAGLNKFTRQTQGFTRYGNAEGLPDEPLGSLLGDAEGNLWFTAGTTLYRFRPGTSALQAFPASLTQGSNDALLGESGERVLKKNTLQKADALAVQFSPRAYCAASDGMLYFGAGAGVVQVQPSAVRMNTSAPPIVLTALKKFNKAIELPISLTEADEIELWYTDNYISFEFAVLSFSTTEKHHCRYKLEGFDKEWIDAGTRNEAVYTNLDGGEYRFRVQVRTVDGAWSEKASSHQSLQEASIQEASMQEVSVREAAVRVIVHPPFWQRRWFYAMAIISTITGVWGVFRWRVRSIERKNVQLEGLVNERTSQLQQSYHALEAEQERTENHATEVQRLNEALNTHNAELSQQTRHAQLEMLRYQLNPHFLFNALISISDLITEDPKHAVRTMTMLMAYLRYALQPAGLPTTPLSEEVLALGNYLAIEQVRFEERLRVEIDIAPEAATVRVPSFLLQPLVENAIKYGMRTSQMPLHIRVLGNINQTMAGKTLVLDVLNSGSLTMPEGISKPSGTGTGLQNIRERLEVLFPKKHRLSLEEVPEERTSREEPQMQGMVRFRVEIDVG